MMFVHVAFGVAIAMRVLGTVVDFDTLISINDTDTSGTSVLLQGVSVLRVACVSYDDEIFMLSDFNVNFFL